MKWAMVRCLYNQKEKFLGDDTWLLFSIVSSVQIFVSCNNKVSIQRPHCCNVLVCPLKIFKALVSIDRLVILVV